MEARMSEHAKAEFKVESWQEDKTVDAETGGTAFAKVEQSLTGDIDGDGLAQWLMCYRADKTADFVGLQRISGRIGDREGSFVLTSNGTFDGKVAAGDMVVVEGSGDGEFAGITGSGNFAAPHGSVATVELDYEIG
jgi:ribulose-5-phosphate 4-epimerase/fuculose-1-phosphate aldolase